MANPPKESKTEDDKRRDKTLERMLKTPPKPHKSGKDKKGGSRRPKSDDTN